MKCFCTQVCFGTCWNYTFVWHCARGIFYTAALLAFHTMTQAVCLVPAASIGRIQWQIDSSLQVWTPKRPYLLANNVVPCVKLSEKSFTIILVTELS